MLVKRIRLSQDNTFKLRTVKGKTGLTPNVLARIGFCMSIDESSIPNPELYDEEGIEIHWFTLVGEYGDFYVALLKEKLMEDGFDLSEENMKTYFRAHINRGASMVYQRVDNLLGLCELALKCFDHGPKGEILG